MKHGPFALAAITALGLGIFACFQRNKADLQVQGLSFVKPGMTKNQALALLGTPKQQKSTVMAGGIYGVPDQMEKRIALGNRFEMWSYEKAIPSKTVYATVWFCPDSSVSDEQTRVVDVTTQVVTRSLQFRLLHWIAQTISRLRT